MNKHKGKREMLIKILSFYKIKCLGHPEVELTHLFY